MGEVIVFTDGSFMRKKTGTYCGYGIYFPNKEFDDVSRSFKKYPMTNQRAELYAVYIALVIIFQNKPDTKYVKLYLDSEYVLKSITVWYKKWEKNNWIGSNKKPIENQDILKSIISYISGRRNQVTFIHVRAHTKGTDFLSECNRKVDELAKKGALKVGKS